MQRSRQGFEFRALGFRKDEHQTIAQIEEVLGETVVGAHPPIVVSVFDAERAQAAIGVLEGLHRHQQPLALRLSGVPTAELEGGFARGEGETVVFDRPGVNLAERGGLREAELGHRGGHEPERTAHGRDGDLREQAPHPVTELGTARFGIGDERLHRRVGADFDGPTDRELVGDRLAGDAGGRRLVDDGLGLGQGAAGGEVCIDVEIGQGSPLCCEYLIEPRKCIMQSILRRSFLSKMLCVTTLYTGIFLGGNQNSTLKKLFMGYTLLVCFYDHHPRYTC